MHLKQVFVCDMNQMVSTEPFAPVMEHVLGDLLVANHLALIILPLSDALHEWEYELYKLLASCRKHKRVHVLSEDKTTSRVVTVLLAWMDQQWDDMEKAIPFFKAEWCGDRTLRGPNRRGQ